MLYHASQTPNIKTLVPHISNHRKPLIYFSSKRENVLVYLSNAVELFARKSGIKSSLPIQKWASYGFDKNGILQLDEYYPDATRQTYSGISGYIYTVHDTQSTVPQNDIPFAFVSENPIDTVGCEFIPDAYEALLAAQKEGKIKLNSYKNNSAKMLEWIRKTTIEEYNNYTDDVLYRAFLKEKFYDFL